MEKIHFDQARLWLQAAKITAEETKSGSKYAVAIAMLIHAIIKANDALTMKLLNQTARRHDDARRLFEDLIKRNLIKQQYAQYKQIIQDAINNKAKAEYRGSFFSKSDFEQLQRKAENVSRWLKKS